MLTPVLALIGWTFVMWLWMYATRLPAMSRAGMDSRKVTKADMTALPPYATSVADNYNHLHEQPTLFYALAFYTHLAGPADPTNIKLAWAYVALRVIHSLLQATVNFVPVRFLLFVTASITLFAIVVRDVLALGST